VRGDVAARVQRLLDQLHDADDWTLGLASLHAACQVYERAVVEAGVDIEHLVHVARQGRRIGATIDPVTELELVGRRDVN